MSYDFEIAPAEYRHEIWERNLTYNLGKMLKRAGFHPNFLSGRNVKELRPVVQNALASMLDNPDYYKRFNPPIEEATGKRWGDYAGAVGFLRELGEALAKAPDEYVMKVM